LSTPPREKKLLQRRPAGSGAVETFLERVWENLFFKSGYVVSSEKEYMVSFSLWEKETMRVDK